MIEIPAAALLADRILRHVEFLSIGTNDLAQYDGGRPNVRRPGGADRSVAARVIALVAHAAQAGAAVDKPVGVCGRPPPTRCWPVC